MAQPRGDRDLSTFTIPEFCDDNRISRTSFYRLLATGRAPKTMMVGHRRLISREAAAEWRRTMEEGHRD
jgi:predicted DNA-binding transcriptional regulator AlpA